MTPETSAITPFTQNHSPRVFHAILNQHILEMAPCFSDSTHCLRSHSYRAHLDDLLVPNAHGVMKGRVSLLVQAFDVCSRFQQNVHNSDLLAEDGIMQWCLTETVLYVDICKELKSDVLTGNELGVQASPAISRPLGNRTACRAIHCGQNRESENVRHTIVDRAVHTILSWVRRRNTELKWELWRLSFPIVVISTCHIIMSLGLHKSREIASNNLHGRKSSWNRGDDSNLGGKGGGGGSQKITIEEYRNQNTYLNILGVLGM